jgi:hypothetical protein
MQRGISFIMKIGCKCGKTIYDNSDGHSEKAWLIPDKNWGSFWSEIHHAITNSGKSREEREYAANSIGRTNAISAYRTLYQCNACGRIYVSNEAGALEIFEPESEATCKTVLNSSIVYNFNPENISKNKGAKRQWWKFWRRA